MTETDLASGSAAALKQDIAMNYFAAFSDFFKSPKWAMNLLLGGACTLIPFVGQIVVLGWAITGFWGRDDENYETFPDFDFTHFGKYLERGLWPFLVTFVASLVMVPMVFVVVFPTMMIGGFASSSNEKVGGCLAALIPVVITFFVMLMVFAMMFLMMPLKIRASITQDFAQSFNFGFVKRFVRLMWMEILLASLFLIIAGTALSLVGLVLFCVGVYAAAVVNVFAWTHLSKQLYRLYVGRGGEPVPLSPKLRDTPPPMPA